MPEKLTRQGIFTVLGPVRFTLVGAIGFFVAAGRVDLPRGWFYFGFAMAGAIAGALINWKLTPELANARGNLRKGTKPWDIAFLLVYSLAGVIGLPIVAGLDVGRYEWSRLGAAFIVPGIILYATGFVLIYWAMIVNRHFEVFVRIQTERDHKVVSDGPYRFVRHPGYVGIILAVPAPSFILGSAYALIPAAIVVAAVIFRTAMEDRMLQRELTGYAEFAQKTRYRLMPGVW